MNVGLQEVDGRSRTFTDSLRKNGSLTIVDKRYYDNTTTPPCVPCRDATRRVSNLTTLPTMVRRHMWRLYEIQRESIMLKSYLVIGRCSSIG